MKLAELDLEVVHGTEVMDLVARPTAPNHELWLIGEVKPSGQPRLARAAINQIARYRQLLPNSYGIFIAPFISNEAAEICRREGVGYLDLAGTCQLTFDAVYIERQGAHNPFSTKRELRRLYSLTKGRTRAEGPAH